MVVKMSAISFNSYPTQSHVALNFHNIYSFLRKKACYILVESLEAVFSATGSSQPIQPRLKESSFKPCIMNGHSNPCISTDLRSPWIRSLIRANLRSQIRSTTGSPIFSDARSREVTQLGQVDLYWWPEFTVTGVGLNRKNPRATRALEQKNLWAQPRI